MNPGRIPLNRNFFACKAPLALLATALLLLASEAFSQNQEPLSLKQKKTEFQDGKERPERKKWQGAPEHRPGMDSLDKENFQFERLKFLISSLSPDDLQKLKELSEKSPEAFREAIERRFADRRLNSNEDEKSVSDAVREFREAKDGEAKENATKKLSAALKKQFDKKMDLNKKRIDLAEQKLNELKKKYQDRMEKTDEIIDDKISELTKDPSLAW